MFMWTEKLPRLLWIGNGYTRTVDVRPPSRRRGGCQSRVK